MKAGELDRRVELRHLVRGIQDNNGQYAPTTYVAYKTVWGKKEEVTGREYFAAQAKQAELTVRFTIRYRSDVLMTDRLTCEGRDYDILSMSEVGRREDLLLFTRVVVQ